MALLGRTDPDAPRIPRKDRRGMSPVLAGVILLVLICIGVFFGFTKKVPFTHGFRMQAVFENANSVRPMSPVRIAGVNVGTVTKIERWKDTNAAVVTFELDDAALPIHKDATAKIRPRIFLEGNFFVDLQPGTPSAPTISDGDTIPMTQTSAPVQIGDVLTALQADTRQSLRDLLQGFGGALTEQPTAADDDQADPDARGETAAQSLNDNFDYAASALRGTAIVNEAFLGLEPNDLGGIVDSLAKVTGALARNERQLQDFVTNFAATMDIFADESASLRASIRELDPTLTQANRTLASLNEAFPPTRAFAREILPGVRESAETIDASFPWIEQMRGLLAPDELQGVARELSPAMRDLATTIDGSVSLLREQSLAAQCFSKVILPTGDVVIDEGDLSSGKENYKELWYTLVGLAGEGQNFDGNGGYVRFQPASGNHTITTGPTAFSGERLSGRTDRAPLGTRPAYPGKRPPYRPDVPCHTQQLPDLNGAATGRPDAAIEDRAPTLGSTAPKDDLGDDTGADGALTPQPAAAASPATRSKVDDRDVAGELLDRLNPFRAGGS